MYEKSFQKHAQKTTNENERREKVWVKWSSKCQLYTYFSMTKQKHFQPSYISLATFNKSFLTLSEPKFWERESKLVLWKEKERLSEVFTRNILGEAGDWLEICVILSLGTSSALMRHKLRGRKANLQLPTYTLLYHTRLTTYTHRYANSLHNKLIYLCEKNFLLVYIYFFYILDCEQERIEGTRNIHNDSKEKEPCMKSTTEKLFPKYL